MDSNQEDIAIIDQVRAGDKGAYAGLVHKYKDYAYTVAFRILGQGQDAEEAAQDAFIKAYKALGKFNQSAKFSTWLYRIVFNTAITYQRKKGAATQPLEDAGDLPDHGLGDPLEASDKKKYLEQAMGQLLPIDATLITLFYIKEQSLQEVGAVVGMNTNAVKVKLFRARKRLAKALGELLATEASTL